MIRTLALLATLLPAALLPTAAHAAEIRVLTAGAYKSVLMALAPAFEAQSGHKLVIQNETAGGVQQKVRAGEPIDLIVLPPAGADALGALLQPGTTRPLAKVGIAVAVRTGAPRPDISTPDAIRAAVIAARAPAWIDPKAGGSSGIYMDRLWERWGIATLVLPKAVLVNGGLVADKLLNDESDLVFQQASELTGVPGVDVLGPLPPEIQSYTVYAGAIPANSHQAAAARQLLDFLSGPASPPVLAAKGMSAP